MEMKDFERRGNGVTYIYKCNIAPLSFNFRQKNQIKLLQKQLCKIPPKIREVWLND